MESSTEGLTPGQRDFVHGRPAYGWAVWSTRIFGTFLAASIVLAPVPGGDRLILAAFCPAGVAGLCMSVAANILTAELARVLEITRWRRRRDLSMAVWLDVWRSAFIPPPRRTS